MQINNKTLFLLLFSLNMSAIGVSQVPDWSVNPNDYLNTMVGIFTISDECVPMPDENDIVAAFDLSGEVRGVQQVDASGNTFLTIYGDNQGEILFFKVYDSSADKIYNVHSYSLPFVSDGQVGLPPEDPVVLNIDSDSQNASGGPDQQLVGVVNTTLEASGEGTWTIIESTGGVLSDPTDPTAAFSGIIGKTYLLAWTLSDTQGCIGETDEVKISFVLEQPESSIALCQDGFDNDNDGLTDCQDPDCGKPIVSNLSKTDPTPLSCTTDSGDGTITVTHFQGDLFSLDNGATTQTSNVFNGLSAGTYDVWIQNGFIGCVTVSTIELKNIFDTDPPAPEFAIIGPDKVCPGDMGITYTANEKFSGDITWSYSGADVSINGEKQIGFVDFGQLTTAGTLMATMSTACTSSSNTLDVELSNVFICNVYSNCDNNLLMGNKYLTLNDATKVIQAGDLLTVSAEITEGHYEFTANGEIELINGFSINSGHQLVTDIRNCTGN